MTTATTTATETDHQITLSNFRVEYHAPDHSKGHTFEPYCAILADTAEFDGKEVRVFDVPDADESQRAVAQFACDAMNRSLAVNDDMRTLLRQWACLMQNPRPKDWEKQADELHKATRLILGNISTAEYDAAHPELVKSV